MSMTRLSLSLSLCIHGNFDNSTLSLSRSLSFLSPYVQGGNVVLAKPGWFAFLESERSRRVGYSGARIHRRSENPSEAQVMRVYECPPEACAGSNVCLGNCCVS